METTDMNGNLLRDGDSVIFTKSMKVKGTQIHLKKGTKVKNIRLNGNPGELECKTPKVKHLALRSELVNKA